MHVGEEGGVGGHMEQHPGRQRQIQPVHKSCTGNRLLSRWPYTSYRLGSCASQTAALTLNLVIASTMCDLSGHVHSARACIAAR